MARSTLSLTNAAVTLELTPHIGGALAALQFHGRDVLRPLPPELSASHLDNADAIGKAARQSACFALLPYSNRIAQRRFDWAGQTHHLAANFDAGYPHALHGVGWRRAWQVTQHSEDSAQLQLTYEADADWPFAFAAEQNIRITSQGATLELTLTNRDSRPQPVGLGWHPYFLRDEAAHLALRTAARWENGPSGLPLSRSACAGVDAPVASLDLDHCYAGWSGRARIITAHHVVTLSADVDHLVLFTPPGRDYFCVEPVSHRNDAIHAADPVAHGLRVLAPQAHLRATMAIQLALPT